MVANDLQLCNWPKALVFKKSSTQESVNFDEPIFRFYQRIHPNTRQALQNPVTANAIADAVAATCVESLPEVTLIIRKVLAAMGFTQLDPSTLWKKTCDCFVVFGCPSLQILTARTDGAIYVYLETTRAGGMFIFSGKSPTNTKPDKLSCEAIEAKKIALQRLPPDAKPELLTEVWSNDTIQNIDNVLHILKGLPSKPRRVFLTSSIWHLPRIILAFPKDFDSEVFLVGVDDQNLLNESSKKRLFFETVLAFLSIPR